MNPDKPPREVTIKIVYYHLLLIGSIIACIGGIAAFLYLFLPDFNIYWLVLSPVIIACYQIPAATLFWLYKNAKRKQKGAGIPPESELDPEQSEENPELEETPPDSPITK